MADVNISKYRASVVRDGSKPASPGFVVSEGQDPVNPPGTNNFVPYTGATANVELGEFGVEAGFVTLDTTPTNIPTDQGAIYWDDTRSTAALIMNGTLQHIGQDSFFYVKNSSGSTIPKGTCVGFAGTEGGSGHLLITPFLANGSVPSTYFMGVTCESIANGSFGQVMHFGELTGINTSGFTAGALLYASSTVAGAFQTTAPVAPNNIILVAAAVNSKNNGAIVVRPTLGSNINTDEGVKITSPTTGDLLQLQAGGLWENKTLAQVIGSAYVPSTRTLTINGTAFDLSANRSWIVGDVRTDGSYSNPSWITALAWSKITGTPTTLSGYGITDAVPSSRTITINGVTQDLSANRTFNVGTVTSVGLSSATSGVTIGSTPVTSSGTITLAIVTASGSQQGLLSASDWTTFNNKQNALTNPVTGTGTTNYLAKFTGSTTIGNSQIFDNGTNVGIGTTNPLNKLSVVSSNVTGYYNRTEAIAVFHGALPTVLIANDANATNQYAELKLGNNQSTYYPYSAYIRGVQGAGIDRYSLEFGTSQGAEATTKVTITQSGNLLVGTTSDNGARLQVSGTATFSGAYGTSSGVYLSGSTYGTYGANRGATIASAGMGYFSVGSQRWFTGIYENSDNFGFYSVGTNGFPLILNYSTGAATFSSSVTASSNIISGGFFQANQGGRDFYLNPSANFGLGDLPTIQVASNHALQFATNNQLRATLTNGGNLLVGTTSDNGERLQVNGSVTATNSGATVGIFNRTTNSGSTLAIQVVGSTVGTLGSDIGGNGIFDISSVSGGVSANRVQISRSGGVLTALFDSNGNVGIGTSSPVYKFVVSNSGATGLEFDPGTLISNRNLLISFNRSTSAYSQIQIDASLTILGNQGNVLIGTTTDTGSRLGIKSSGTNSFPLIVQRSANTNTLAAISETSGGDGIFLLANSLGSTNIQLLSNGTSILNGGNVLIGTTTSTGDKLRVAGNTFSNTIMTWNPENDNRSGVEWRLGAASIGLITPNRRLRVNVGGVEYFIGAVEV